MVIEDSHAMDHDNDKTYHANAMDHDNDKTDEYYHSLTDIQSER